MLDCHIPFYQGDVNHLDTNQKNYLFWCRYYYSHVYSQEELERPDDFTVSSDILLDDWVDRKRFRQKNEERGGKTANNSQQVINF